jgi:hypothetical protein
MASVSLVDYLGVLESGVTIQMSLQMQETEIYNFVYWIHPSGRWNLVMDPKFLVHYGFETIYDHPNLSDLIHYLDHKILPPKNEIWQEFGLI